MSLSTTFYVGPFVACQFKGKRPDYFDILEKLNESLCQPLGDDFSNLMKKNKFDIYISNIKDGIGLSIENSEGYFLKEINSIIIEKEIKDFCDFHKKSIDILKDYYEKVEVSWGALAYIY